MPISEMSCKDDSAIAEKAVETLDLWWSKSGSKGFGVSEWAFAPTRELCCFKTFGRGGCFQGRAAPSLEARAYSR